ncbi:hypothetical protein [Caudoviricetes sp.]|nr:hypothetical protein [Caudoviricetes sp.]
MALSYTTAKLLSRDNSAEKQAITGFNDLCDAVRAICVALDADSGVTATTFTATFDAAVTKIKDESGTEV